MTILFCDVTGSTSMAELFDPEEWTEIIDEAFHYMAEAVERYDGHVAKFLGDGMLALFGAPKSHEDDAQRAVYAALEIIQSLQFFRDELKQEYGLDFNVRIGLNTGLVVFGTIGSGQSSEFTVTGDVVNVAARMEQTAEPGTVQISDSTYKRVSEFFQCEFLGAMELKGKSEAIRTFRVSEALPSVNRIERSSLQGLTDFVGREREIDVLKTALNNARQGNGGTIGIFGDAGVGKSRILFEFRKTLESDVLYIESRCPPFGGVVNEQPITALLRGLSGFAPNDCAGTGRLEADLPNDLEAFLPFFRDLLGHPSNDFAISQLSPPVRKSRTIDGLIKLLAYKATLSPVVIAVDDLHWGDQTTEDLITEIVGATKNIGILLILMSRPDYGPPWAEEEDYNALELAPLPDEAGRALTNRFLNAPINQSLADYVLTHTGGNPMFVEELLKGLLESGLLSLNGEYSLLAMPETLQIPDSVQGVLDARIDQLADTARQTLRVASVIGAEVPIELLEYVYQAGSGQKPELTSLVEMQLLIPTGADRYEFKHALIREAAYAGLLKRNRRRLHRIAAEAVESISPELAAHRPEVLAHHYEEASNTSEAVRFFHSAAKLAIQKSANRDAVSYLKRGLELIHNYPDRESLVQAELGLQTSLGVALMAAKGPGAAEVEAAFNEAQKIYERAGENAHLFPVLFGLWRYYLLRSNLKRAEALAEQLLNLSGELQDNDASLEAHFAAGSTVFWTGNVARARSHFRKVIDAFDPDTHQSQIVRFGQSPFVTSMSYDAFSLWLSGCPDQALKRIEQTIQTANDASHPFSLAYALFAASMVHQLRGEVLSVQSFAEQDIKLSEEHGFPYFQIIARILLAWSQVEQGKVAPGLNELHTALSDLQGTGSKANSTYYLALYAAASGKANQARMGLDAIAAARTAAGETGEKLWKAELLRVQGDLLLQSGDASETEIANLYLKAIETARSQQLLSLELRARTSLASMYQTRDCSNEIVEGLAACLEKFSEGLQTPDLADAKSLVRNHAL